MHVIGKTGTGKTTLLETLAVQDLHAGRGLCLIDPHGDFADRFVERVPKEVRDRVVYLNAPDRTQPYGYNPLRQVRAERRSLAASGLLETFKSIWTDAWGVRMEHVLRNALLLLLEQPGASLPDVLRLVSDDKYRRACAVSSENPQVKQFWLKEYDGYSKRYRADSIAPIQNKVGAFLADPLLYRILVTPERDLRIRKIMDEGGVLIVNLAKGKIGQDSASLLGSLLVTTVGLAAFSRAELAERGRRPFFLYIDEFQEFTTRFLADMTSELRKYGVGLVLAHQVKQLAETTLATIQEANSGTQDVSAKVKKQLTQLEDSLGRVTGSITSLEEKLRRLEGSIGPGMEQAYKGLEAVRTSIAADVDVVRRHRDELQSLVESSRGMVGHVHQAMTGLARSVVESVNGR
jgi:Type IV secretion-system coupling protein DNA-binding domain